MGGAAAGEDDIGAEASSIDPNVTTEPGKERKNSICNQKRGETMNKPCFKAAAPTLPRGILTPSLMGTPWPRALVRRE